MKSKRGTSNSKMTIIGIVILDIILMSLFMFFSDQLLKDFQYSTNFAPIIISSFAIVIPGTLLILIIFQFYRLIKYKNASGNHFKRNIIIYFIVSITLVVIPISLISLNFINVSANNWLSNRVVNAVDIGFNMALDKEIEIRENVSKLSEDKYFSQYLRDIYRDKNSDFIIEFTDPFLISVEILDTQGLSIVKMGRYFLDSVTLNSTNHFYPKVLKEGTEIIYYQYKTSLFNNNVTIILGVKLPYKFSENGLLLTNLKNSLQETSYGDFSIKSGMGLFFILFSLPLFLLAILGTFIFSDQAVKPLKDIEDAIEYVSKGNYSYRILSKKNNEFNILINSFNNMIKEIEKSRNKLKHTEQISTWQDIATRLAHEIKNPLTPIKLSAQKMLMKKDTPNNTLVTTKYMETIIKEVTRMEHLLNEFRDFARFPQLNIKHESVKKILEEAISIYRSSNPKIVFDFSAVDDIDADLDKNQMIHVISNLTINSIHSLEGEVGIIYYSAEIVLKKGIEFCRISIKDMGKGIPESIKKDIFKPYFTTKYDGTGLGLAIVNKIVLDHKGKIWLESAEGVGTTFYFEIPRYQ